MGSGPVRRTEVTIGTPAEAKKKQGLPGLIQQPKKKKKERKEEKERISHGMCVCVCDKSNAAEKITLLQRFCHSKIR